MVYHQCGLFHAASSGLMLRIWCHTGSSWMVYHQCGLFHAASSGFMLRICCHTGSSWMVYHQCGFFYASTGSTRLLEPLNQTFWYMIRSVSLAVANILLPVWRNLVCGNFIQIKFTNTQVFGKQKKLLIFGLNTWGDSNQLWRGSWQQLSFLVKRRKYKQIVIRKIFISDKPDQPV